MRPLPARIQHRPRSAEHRVWTIARARRAARRVLRQDGERQRLRYRQLAWILAEVDEARCRGALEVPAVGDEVEIRLEDRALGVAALELERPGDLDELAGGGGGVGAIDEPGP